MVDAVALSTIMAAVDAKSGVQLCRGAPEFYPWGGHPLTWEFTGKNFHTGSQSNCQLLLQMDVLRPSGLSPLPEASGLVRVRAGLSS